MYSMKVMFFALLPHKRIVKPKHLEVDIILLYAIGYNGVTAENVLTR